MKKTETYYAIHVVQHPKGLNGITSTLKGQVYLGKKGKLCSIGNECAFASEQEALERIKRFKPKAKNRNEYEFEIVECGSTIGVKGSILTPQNYYISILKIPEERLVRQPSLRILFERDGCVLGGNNIPVKHKKAHWFETQSDAREYIEKLQQNPRFEGFVFRIEENPDSKK
ncbi:hypothetical protein [Pontiella sulfatireligans]|uniref:Uncharacterized protein n=1 Tax=Pontiella sulfatireligans TaxID=2750658 RepID=A0A6C2UDE8_9BACT|nr:hypothetical protein [Pontiella sulfatireligans]VGO18232.1 hypothetical protein SCARR_00283 [Pontiella sulfatireligans]